MSERNFSVDDILAEIAANKGDTYEKRVQRERRETDSLIDDILAEAAHKKESAVSVASESDVQPSEPPLEPDVKVREKKERKKNKKEEADPLADITPWNQRHTEIPQEKTGVRESQDFLATLKEEHAKEDLDATQLLYKNAGSVHPPVDVPPAQPVGEMKEVKQEDVQKQVSDVAQQMESVYEPTRHVDAPTKKTPSGFEQSPTTAIPLAKGVKADELTGQVRLPGFDTGTQLDIPQKATSWEGEFLSDREEKVSNFHMETEEASEPSAPKTFEEDGDYHSLAEAEEVKFDLLARRRNATLRMVVTFALFVCSVLFTIVEKFDITNGLLYDNPTLTVGLYGACLLAGILVNARLVWGGFSALFRGGDQDTPAALGMALAVVQGIAAVICCGSDITGSTVFSFIGCASLLGVVMNLWGKRLLFTRMYRNFELVGTARTKKAVASVKNREEAFELGRGLAVGAPQVAYSRKGVDLEQFVYHSYAPDMVEKSAGTILYFTPLFGILGGLFAFFFLPHNTVATTVFLVLSGFCGCMQIALPIASLVGGNAPFHWVTKRLRAGRIMLSGYDAVSEFNHTDVLALDASELFPAGSVTLKSIKSASNQSLDRSIRDVAGVVYMADSPLKPLFENIIQGKTNLLPEVDTLVYEEEMGISGWVMGYRVLVGTRKLMENHGILVPDVNYEEKYNEFGLKAVYLSTQGTLSAVFLVKYAASPRVMDGLQRVVKEGTSLHIYSCDPNITKELICKMFRLPAASVRIMGAVPRRLYKQQMEKEESLQAVLSYEGNAGAFGRAICAVKKLYRVLRVSAVLQALFVILGGLAFCVGLYLGFFGISGLLLTLYHLVSTFLILCIPRLMGR